MQRLHLPLVVACAGALGACTIITVSDAKQVHREWLPGFAVVNVEPDSLNGSAISIEGYGVVFGTASAALGVHREQVVLLPSDAVCQAVFFIDSEADLKAAFDLLKAADPDRKGLCVSSANGGMK